MTGEFMGNEVRSLGCSPIKLPRKRLWLQCRWISRTVRFQFHFLFGRAGEIGSIRWYTFEYRLYNIKIVSSRWSWRWLWTKLMCMEICSVSRFSFKRKRLVILFKLNKTMRMIFDNCNCLTSIGVAVSPSFGFEYTNCSLEKKIYV